MAMHSNWNPWHGCIKCSEGCRNCYVYYLDRMRGKNGADVYKTKTGFKYPLSKNKNKEYKIKSGEMISVCMTSDFFLAEADEWRSEAWEMMQKRSDVIFLLLTKRPERIMKCLPDDWGTGWENIFLNVTCENQQRADERIPILLDLPFKHKGLHCAPSFLIACGPECFLMRLMPMTGMVCQIQLKMQKRPDHCRIIAHEGYKQKKRQAAFFGGSDPWCIYCLPVMSSPE